MRMLHGHAGIDLPVADVGDIQNQFQMLLFFLLLQFQDVG